MKIVFFGCVEFSEILLNGILEDGNAEVVGIVTRSTSNINADFCSLDKIAIDNGIPFLYANDTDENDLEEWIKKHEPDVIYCLGWSFILKEEIIKIPPKGVIGYHPASLPQNRGRHPIIWALALGLNETASTFFFIDEGVDTGDIISQIPITIEEHDNAQSLYDKLVVIAEKQVSHITEQLKKDNYIRIPQDGEKTNYWRKRTQNDGIIDWRMSCKSIYNLVRAITKPYIGADIIVNGEYIKVWKVTYEENNYNNIEPGKVIRVNNMTVSVKCADGLINIIEHEFNKLPQVGDYL